MFFISSGITKVAVEAFMDTWLQRSPGRHRQLFLDAAFVELGIGHNKGARCCVLGRNVLSAIAPPSCIGDFEN